MGDGIFGIGTSGLLTAQQQIATAGHNISNVNTEGFARQRTESSATTPRFSGNGYTGTGVKIDTTKRFYNEFLEEQIRTSNSQLGRFERFNQLAGQIDDIIANPDAGLTPTLEGFYNAMQEANDFPSGVPARSVLITSANTLADRFTLLQNRFIDLNNQTNSNLGDVAAEITARAASIAELNNKIAVQIGSGNGNLPNDTLDKRENLIKEISQRIDVSVVYQSNGAANIFIGTGQALVLNSTSFAMEIRDSEYSPKDKEIFLTSQNTAVNITSQIKGGELQGLVDFKSQVLEPSFNGLGRIAASLSKEMNDQHGLGLTLQKDSAGNYIKGGNFFKDITTAQNTLASNKNTGTAAYSIDIIDTSVLTISDYELSYSTTGGNTFTLKRLSDNTTYTGTDAGSIVTALANLNTDLSAAAARPKGPQGININLASGVVADGDKFLVQPTQELARSMAVTVNNVLDIALASPIVVAENKDALGVGQNTGTAKLSFLPLETANLTAVNTPPANIPIVDGGGNRSEITIDQYGLLGANTFTVSGGELAVAGGPYSISYNPATDSGNPIALPAPYGYMNITFTGVPDANDSFTLGNNQFPQDDNRNGLIMANIQTKKTIQNGSADFQRAYGLIVAEVGTRTYSSQVDLQAQTTLNDQAKQNRNSLSGVNLDEEASNLLRFQQAYQSSAKVISVANEVFNTLLNTVG